MTNSFSPDPNSSHGSQHILYSSGPYGRKGSMAGWQDGGMVGSQAVLADQVPEAAVTARIIYARLEVA